MYQKSRFSVLPERILSAQDTLWRDFSATQLHISTETIRNYLSMFWLNTDS